ncbi:acyltransferase domain-containing protein [Tumebacillus lipolyticus]|uniref:Acyltransferase domain-containing protein n=1 Tax=Tumebacillus lipolyticus TaxID=1280370 RepID=A0ABW4ZV10_9BACL
MNTIGRERTHHLFTLSGHSRQAARNAVEKLLHHLDYEPDQQLGDLAHTLHVGRVAFDHRVTLVAQDREELKALCQQQLAEQLSGRTREQERKIVFLFSGQGSQYTGMGQTLYQTSSVFKTACEECFAIANPLFPRTMQEYMFDPAYRAELDQFHVTSVALFIVEYALAQLWMSWGVRPDYVFGHSLGEYVAACIAGGLTLRDALRLVAKRGQLIYEGIKDTAMLSISSTREQVEQYVALYPNDVAIATINSPQQFVIGGRREQIDLLAARLEQDDVMHRRVKMSTATHTMLSEPIVEPFRQFVEREIELHPLQIPLVSNLDGEMVQGRALQADYWCRHLAETVQFAASAEALFADGANVFIEMGPHPVLTALIGTMATDDSLIAVPSLNRKEPQWKTIQDSLGRIWCDGANIDWQAVDKEYSYRRVHGPTYGFDLKSCWIEQQAEYSKQRRGAEADVREPMSTDSTTDEAMVTRSPEEWVRIIWREVLGVREIAGDDNFLTLGGESLNMIQVQSRLNKAFQLRLQLSDLYRHAQFDDLVRFIEQKATEAGRELPVKKERAVEGEVQLSHIQRWVFDSVLDPEFYFLPISLEATHIRGDVVQRALDALHERHDMLRATYHREGKQIRQVILPMQDVQIELLRYDLSSFADGEAQDAEYLRLELELAKSITFDQGLMNRAALFDLGADRYRLLWVVSHLYSDRVSGAILIEDFIEAYESLDRGEQATSADSSSSYQEWVDACQAYIDSEQSAELDRFWEPVLEEIESASRRLVDPQQELSTQADMRVREFRLDGPSTAKLRSTVPADLDVQLKDVLTGIVARVLSIWSDEELISFAINGHGRDELGGEAMLDLSRTVGYFVNTHPFALSVAAGESIEQTIRKAGDRLQAMPHGGATFNMLRYLSENGSLGERMSRYREPQILFNHQGEIHAAGSSDARWSAGFHGNVEQPMERPTPYSLILVSSIQQGEWVVQANYSARQFDKVALDRLERLFATEVESLLALTVSQ